MLKLQNILQYLSVGRDSGMIFLLPGHIVLMNLTSKKFQFTMDIPNNTLEFLDLKHKFDKNSKQISVEAFAKDTNSFTYVLPSTCFRKNNIERIPQGVALRLRRT